jgi:phosphoglycolate phosphatase-like HAD superfamily hydrolase
MSDGLALWRDGPVKGAIVDFVDRVSRQESPQFVPPAQRIAVFDNDGTLWSEQPFYFQGLFVFDRVSAMAPDHPEWASTQPFQAVLESDWQTLAQYGNSSLFELAAATLGSNSLEEYQGQVSAWLETARHPALKRPFTECVFDPMLELLTYLKANDFKTFIVSGGGIEFIRQFSEDVYGIPPERVIGSSLVTHYDVHNGQPILARAEEIDFIDDKDGKPVGIQQHIGRRPIAAFGNSDGDLEMMEWVIAGKGARMGVMLHHDDADREFAYDRISAAGKLDLALDEAQARGLTIVSMKNDWKRVFRWENETKSTKTHQAD